MSNRPYFGPMVHQPVVPDADKWAIKWHTPECYWCQGKGRLFAGWVTGISAKSGRCQQQRTWRDCATCKGKGHVTKTACIGCKGYGCAECNGHGYSIKYQWRQHGYAPYQFTNMKETN